MGGPDVASTRESKGPGVEVLIPYCVSAYAAADEPALLPVVQMGFWVALLMIGLVHTACTRVA
jgi:hypothetical protein